MSLQLEATFEAQVIKALVLDHNPNHNAPLGLPLQLVGQKETGPMLLPQIGAWAPPSDPDPTPSLRLRARHQVLAYGAYPWVCFSREAPAVLMWSAEVALALYPLESR